jgi:hypothetical protein
MSRLSIRLASLCGALALASVAYFGAPPRAEASADCYYAGQSYSQGACRGGQRCSSRLIGDAYWSDDMTCLQTGSGQGGGIPQV